MKRCPLCEHEHEPHSAYVPCLLAAPDDDSLSTRVLRPDERAD